MSRRDLVRNLLGCASYWAAEEATTLGEALYRVGVFAAYWPRLSGHERRQIRIASLGLAGLIDRRRAKKTGTEVGIYDSEKSGMETGEPGLRYSLVCEEHGSIVCVETMAQAREHAPDPTQWCDDCRGADDRSSG